MAPRQARAARKGGARPADPISVKAAAAILGCDTSTVYRMIYQGRLDAFGQRGTRWVLPRAQVLALAGVVPPQEADALSPTG